MKENPKEIIKEKILIFDGAMGTYISRLGLKPEDFGGYYGLNEYLNITRPEVIQRIHLEYYEAGADIIETNTFGANALNLAEYNLEKETRRINITAAKLACCLRDKFPRKNGRKFVAGSIGPTNKSIFVTGGISFDEMKEVYRKQAEALIEGGVDFLILETSHDIMNARSGLAAISEISEEFARRTIVSLTMDRNNLMLSGQDIKSAYAALEHFPLFALGFNCSTGPEDMESRIETLSQISRFPIIIMPNAGLPNEKGEYSEDPNKFSEVIKKYAAAGFVNIAGGCCGTGPEHIKKLSERLRKVRPRKIPKFSRRWFVSGIDALFFEDIEPPLLIGERNNSVGSRKFKELVKAGKWDEAASVAKRQADAGAHMLDICMSNPERDEMKDIEIFIPIVARAVRIPLMIDTTNVDIMEAALKLAPGKCVINSVNLESGEKNLEKAARLNRVYGAKIVFGTIDEHKRKGLPLSAAQKVEIAKKGYKILKNLGIRDEDIIFDVLVFPVSVNEDYRRSGFETIKAIKTIKEKFPNVKTVLGISNVSFGLPPKAREVLNSVFFHHAARAGLDMAIVNVEKLKELDLLPENEIKMAEELLFAKCGDDSSRKMADYYRERKSAAVSGEKSSGKQENTLFDVILEGDRSQAARVTETLLKKKRTLEIINGPILKAMEKVGQLFGKGDMIITEVLQSAEVVKEAIRVLKPHFKSDMPQKGKFLVATVNGDVHDIGKNLVRMIFESNGFKVVDLGVSIPAKTIVERTLEECPDFIGLSGLLVRSTKEMLNAAEMLRDAGVKVPLFLGGAALTSKFVDLNIKPVYNGPVIYSPSAMDGLNEANKLHGAARRPQIASSDSRVADHKSQIAKREPQSASRKSRIFVQEKYWPVNVAKPRDLSRHFVEEYDLEEIFKNINESLFNARFLKIARNNPEIKKGRKSLEEVKKFILENKVIKPKAVYRIFKAGSEKNKLLVFSPKKKVLEEFDFPRQKGEKNLCLSDFINPVSKGGDYVGFFIVSCGSGIRKFVREQMRKGNFLRAYLTEALSLSSAEAFAELIHYEIRKSFSIAEKYSPPLHLSGHRGKRFSFGYGACPDLSNQKKLFHLLKPQKDVGVKLTRGFMMEPEASVSAIVVHNPKAEYFSV